MPLPSSRALRVGLREAYVTYVSDNYTVTVLPAFAVNHFRRWLCHGPARRGSSRFLRKERRKRANPRRYRVRGLTLTQLADSLGRGLKRSVAFTRSALAKIGAALPQHMIVGPLPKASETARTCSLASVKLPTNMCKERLPPLIVSRSHGA